MLLSNNQEIYNYKISARPDRRRQFEHELVSAMEIAIGILTACLSINEFKEQVIFRFQEIIFLILIGISTIQLVSNHQVPELMHLMRIHLYYPTQLSS